MGLAFIGRGVSTTRKQFNLPSLSGHTAEALREFPRARPDVVGTAYITMALQGVSATGSVGTLGSAPPRDVESRLDALERDYQALRATVANNHGDTQEQFRKHGAEIEAERTERAKEADTLRSALRETAIGGLDFAVHGIIVGIFATLYSNFAHDIANYLGGETATSTCTQIVVQPRPTRIPLTVDAHLVRT